MKTGKMRTLKNLSQSLISLNTSSTMKVTTMGWIQSKKPHCTMTSIFTSMRWKNYPLMSASTLHPTLVGNTVTSRSDTWEGYTKMSL